MNYSDVSARINFALQDLGVQLSFQDVMTRTIPYIFKKPNRADPFLELYSSVMPVANSYRKFFFVHTVGATGCIGIYIYGYAHILCYCFS